MSDRLYRFTVSLHGYRAGSFVTVAEEHEQSVEPLVLAGYLVPLHPAPPARRERQAPAPPPEGSDTLAVDADS